MSSFLEVKTLLFKNNRLKLQILLPKMPTVCIWYPNKMAPNCLLKISKIGINIKTVLPFTFLGNPFHQVGATG